MIVFEILIFICILSLHYEIEKLVTFTTSIERRIRRLEIEHGINLNGEDKE